MYIFILLLFATRAFSAIPDYPDAKCPGELREIGPRTIIGQTDRRFLIQDSSFHIQQPTHTCYAHAATVTLNALLKSQQFSTNSESKSPVYLPDLHTLESFARGGLPIADGGNMHEFFWKLRHVPLIPQGVNLSLKDSYAAYTLFHKKLTELRSPHDSGVSLEDYERCRSEFSRSTSIPMKRLLKELDKVFRKGTTPSERPYYQMNTWCFSDKAEIRKKLFEHFSTENPLPLNITICLKMDSGICADNHALAVTGIQRLNCSNSSEENTYSVEVYNSWGDGINYIDMNRLIQGILDSGDLITELVSCPSNFGEGCLDQIANQNDPNSCALHAYLEMGEIERAQKIMTSSSLLSHQVTSNGRTPLFIATDKGYFEIVSALIKVPGIDVNKAFSDSVTPLAIASQNGHVEIVKKLLENPDTDPNKAQTNGITPLYIASQLGHSDVVIELAKDPRTQVNQAFLNGVTPLFISSQNGHVSVVRTLLKNSHIHVNQPAFLNALSAAKLIRSKGYLRVAEEFERRVKMRSGESDYMTPLIIAAILGKKEVIQELLIHPQIEVTPTYLDLNAAQWAHIAGHAEIEALILTQELNPASDRAKQEELTKAEAYSHTR